MDVIKSYKSKSSLTAGMGSAKYDEFGRLIFFSGKTEVECPAQSAGTGVLLVIGQSNAANHADKKINTKYPAQVLNYFDGKCYIAASPLLGSTGEDGEFLTPLADQLIDRNIYRNVVIISSAVAGTSVSRWQEDGDMNQMLMDTLTPIKKYKVTDVVWHQGESDYGNTSAKVYEKSFYSLKRSLKAVGVNAPFFVAVATKCGHNPDWIANNHTAEGQKNLEDNKQIFLAVNTDEMLTNEDRSSDYCHFSESGQFKTAQAYAQVIEKFRQRH
jgi:hypothetical protein